MLLAALGLATAPRVGAQEAPQPQGLRPIDRVAAVVNDQMIPFSEVHQRAAPDLNRLASEGGLTEEKRAKLLRAALDEAISDRLLATEQKALGLEVTDSDVDVAIDDVRRQNKMDAATFERALMGQGMSLADYREKLKRDLAVMKLLGNKVRSKIKVTDEDVKAEYARRARLEGEDLELRARHIVIQVPEGGGAEGEESARIKAAELAARARAGEDFAELARRYSDSPSKAEGGDVGFFRRGDMVAPFERAVFAMKPGEVSEPVRTPFGWHVILLVEQRAVMPADFEKVREELRDRLIREQMKQLTEQYLDELRRQATIEIKARELR